MADPVTPSTQRLPLLDGMRGIAAIMVMLFHEAGQHGQEQLFDGFLAVDFFILLSGYVIARTYEPRFWAGLGVRQFIWNRSKRLYPLMALGTVIGAFQYWLGMGWSGLAGMFVLGLLFIPHIGSAYLYPLNTPQWSLLFEFLLNLVHAAVLHRLGWRCLIAAGAICAAALAVSAQRLGTLNLGFSPALLWIGGFRLAYTYIVGILLARHFNPAHLNGGAGWRTPLLLLALLILIPAQLTGSGRWLAQYGIIVAGFPLLLVLALRTKAPDAAAPLLDWLGRMSFPLYAVHLPLLGLAALVAKANPDLALPVRLAGVVLALGVAAWLGGTRLGGKPARKAPVREALA